MIQNQMNGIAKDTKNQLGNLETRTSGMIDSTRKKLILNDWINVAKYGLGTAIFVVPIFLIIKSLLTFVGIQV